jgi:hypothetical protein
MSNDAINSSNSALIQLHEVNKQNKKWCKSQITNNKCKICLKTFDKLEAGYLHAALQHAKYKPFGCHQCNESFCIKQLLNHHIVFYHEQSHNCRFCYQRFITLAELTIHVDVVHRYNPKCVICFKNFTSEIKLEIHKHQAHGTGFVPVARPLLP